MEPAVLDPGGLGRIREFVAHFWADSGQRPTTDDEKRLIEDALINYLLREDTLTRRPSETRASGLQALQHLARHLPAIARPSAKLVERCILELATNLVRREEANDILQEHLVLLSEDVRIRRLQSGSDEPQPPYRGDGQ